MKIYKYILQVLALVTLSFGCKLEKAPKLEVPEQSFACSSELCRTVDEPTECRAMDGNWSEELNECLTTTEYEKWQCITNSKFWSDELSKCNPTAEEIAEHKKKTEEESKEALTEKDTEDSTPKSDRSDTNVDVNVIIVE